MSGSLPRADPSILDLGLKRKDTLPRRITPYPQPGLLPHLIRWQSAAFSTESMPCSSFACPFLEAVPISRCLSVSLSPSFSLRPSATMCPAQRHLTVQPPEPVPLKPIPRKSLRRQRLLQPDMGLLAFNQLDSQQTR